MTTSRRYQMTSQAYQRLLDKRAHVQQQLDEANALANDELCLHCGLTDNPTFNDAIKRTHMLSTRLSQIDAELAQTEVIADDAADTVVIGRRVTVDFDGEQETYFIGGVGDSAPHDGVVSHTSPFGAALIGRRAGDCVEVSTPSGIVTVRILSIASSVPDPA